jgi:hypothetical protein
MAIVGVLVAGCASAPPGAGDRAAHHPRARHARAAGGSAAATALARLPIKGRAPRTGYSRDQFGAGWGTIDGCDTRDRILARDLTRKTLAGCEVERGVLADPYTATAITYVRDGASEVDIDHVVALEDAWQKGAQQWPRARREAFANDPLNLLAVDSHENRSKGDGDAATWLPPNKRFRCDYVARQIAVKRRYGAWVTKAEHDAMARVLSACPSEKLPRAPRRPAMATSGRHFASCAAVRAAGLAPLRRGTPAYEANPQLDRDKDGLACE